jgi:hypothetical protein
MRGGLKKGGSLSCPRKPLRKLAAEENKTM